MTIAMALPEQARLICGTAMMTGPQINARWNLPLTEQRLEETRGSDSHDGCIQEALSDLECWSRSNESFGSSAKTWLEQRGVGSNGASRLACVGPWNAVGGGLALAVLKLGQTVILLPGDHPVHALSCLERCAGTHLYLTSRVLRQLVQEDAAMSLDLSALQDIWYTGSTLSPDEISLVEKLLGCTPRRISTGNAVPREREMLDLTHAQAEPVVQHLTVDKVQTLIDAMDRAILLSMLAALQQSGLLLPTTEHSVEEVLRVARVKPEHHVVLRRWFRILRERGWILERRNCLLCSKRVQPDAVYLAWSQVRQLWFPDFGSPHFVEYLEQNCAVLPELMQGLRKAVFLLFPEGKADLARAFYRDTVTARYLNTAIAFLVISLAGTARRKRPFRILEIGAGTGATSIAIADTVKKRCLDFVAFDYLFTDVSTFFLEEAERSLDLPGWMRFSVFDMDKALPEYGIKPWSVDLIIAAGALNNSRNVDKALHQLSRLLTPGGHMILTEATREHLEMLVSQAFMIEGNDDVRQKTDATFLSRSEWESSLHRAGATSVLTLPKEDAPVALLGQRLFFSSF